MKFSNESRKFTPEFNYNRKSQLKDQLVAWIKPMTLGLAEQMNRLEAEDKKDEGVDLVMCECVTKIENLEIDDLKITDGTCWIANKATIPISLIGLAGEIVGEINVISNLKKDEAKN